MARVALIAPSARLRPALIALADAGVAQLVGPIPAPEGEAVEALRRLERAEPLAAGRPGLTRAPREVEELEQKGRHDLLAGEVELDRRARSAIRHGDFAALVAWVPVDEVEPLGARLAEAGAAVVELPRPALVEPPTLLRPGRLARPFRPLLDTYGAIRYGDVDPTPFAAASFVLMFGMMFGDVGSGLLLSLLGLLLRRSRAPRLAGLRPLWPFLLAGGLVATVFGLLYGEFFGPTGIVPVIWIKPTDEPVRLLAAALAVGAILLSISYAVGVLNRLHEGGLRVALLAPSGIAGFALFAGGGLAALALYLEYAAPAIVGAVIAGAGMALLFVGFAAEAGFGAAGIGQAIVQLFDSVIRVAANLLSFTRLAAFGLMHGAIGAVVLDAASALWGGIIGSLLAIIVFVTGNALAFALEALVAGVQAIRLEYYELFTRVFAGQGEVFSPWRVPLSTSDVSVITEEEG
jgi:V/A-type H+-transporting ATPase subunit I